VTTVASSQSPCTRISDRLVELLGKRRYSMWFDRSACLDYCAEPPRLEVAVPNQFIADWIRRNFRGALRDAARGEGGGEVDLAVRVDPERFKHDRVQNGRAEQDDTCRYIGQEIGQEVATDIGRVVQRRAERYPGRDARPEASPEARRLDRAAGSTAKRAVAQSAADLAAPRTAKQNLRHRLESFIVGPSNELGYSAAVRLVEDESAAAPNPLFIHGGCGLGKTHLLQGLCRRAHERHPGGAVLYTTAEQFTNEFLTAIRTNRIDAFRRRIRQLELLAVDDVHFLANKQATQQEFLHSFDAIQLSGAKLALASDNHPQLIRQFSEQLISRCMRGMVVEVRTPDTETRMRVIRALAAGRGLSLLDGVIETLGQHCRGSVREIEGTLTKLHALASLAERHRNGSCSDNQIGHALLNRLLHGEFDTARKVVRFENIEKVVCVRMRVSRGQLTASRGSRQVVLARSLLIHLARRMTSMSFPEIAAKLDRRSHSTVVTASGRVDKMIADNAVVDLPGAMEPEPVTEWIEQLHDAIRRT